MSMTIKKIGTQPSKSPPSFRACRGAEKCFGSVWKHFGGLLQKQRARKTDYSLHLQKDRIHTAMKDFQKQQKKFNRTIRKSQKQKAKLENLFETTKNYTGKNMTIMRTFLQAKLKGINKVLAEAETVNCIFDKVISILNSKLKKA